MTTTPSIGVATLEQDGTLVLTLRATGDGVVGDARLVYRPDDAQYDDVMAHVGPLEAGETKPVRPWPESLSETSASD